MNKKLKKAIEKMEKRTSAIIKIQDYDDIQDGMKTMSNRYKYALWIYGVKMNNGQYIEVNCGNGRVIARFITQIEAINAINLKEFDSYIIPEV